MSDTQQVLIDALKAEGGNTPAAVIAPVEATQNTETTTATPQAATTETTTETVVEAPKVEMDDSSVLNYLKSKGLDYSSLDDLKQKPKEATAEEIAAQKEQEENDKFSWAIKNVVSKNKYESYLSVVKDPLGAVLADAKKDALAADPDLDVEEFISEFKDKYGVDADENSVKFKQGKKAIETLAKELVREQFPEILTIDSKYNEHKSNVQKQAEVENTISKGLPLYAQKLQASIEKTKTFRINLGGDEVFEFNADPETIKDFVTEISKKENATNAILNNVSDATIDRELQVAYLTNNLPNILNSFKAKVIEAYEKERRGVLVGSNDFVKQVKRSDLTAQDEKYDPYAAMGLERPNSIKN